MRQPLKTSISFFTHSDSPRCPAAKYEKHKHKDRICSIPCHRRRGISVLIQLIPLGILPRIGFGFVLSFQGLAVFAAAYLTYRLLSDLGDSSEAVLRLCHGTTLIRADASVDAVPTARPLSEAVAVLRWNEHLSAQGANHFGCTVAVICLRHMVTGDIDRDIRQDIYPKEREMVVVNNDLTVERWQQ